MKYKGKKKRTDNGQQTTVFFVGTYRKRLEQHNGQSIDSDIREVRNLRKFLLAPIITLNSKKFTTSLF